MLDAIEESARQIQGQRAWNDGWIAVRGIIRYDSKDLHEEIRAKLHRLEKLLKPVDLLEQARTFALSDQHGAFDLADDFDDHENPSAGWSRAEEMTRKIGAQVAQRGDVLKALLPDLVSTDNIRLYSFGKGLADECKNKQELWHLLRTALEETPPEKRQIRVICGFLSSCAERDPSFYNSTLNGLIHDNVLGEWFPIFQMTSTIDQRGVERLHDALDLGKAHIWTFQNLAWGRAHESIGDDELAGLLTKMYTKEGGIEVVIDILRMRFDGQNKESPTCSDNLLAVAQDVLSMYTWDNERRRASDRDYVLAEIACICLNRKEGVRAATHLGQQLAKAIAEHRIYAFDYPALLKSLAQVQPLAFLDAFLGGHTLEDYQRIRIFSDDFGRYGNPLNQIPDDVFLSWCEQDAAARYPLVASAIQVFTTAGETSKVTWKPIVYALFESAPDLDAVLQQLSGAIRPISWSGSRANILQTRSVLFQDLFQHDNAKIRAWANSQYSALQETITNEREWEERQNAERDERFE